MKLLVTSGVISLLALAACTHEHDVITVPQQRITNLTQVDQTLDYQQACQGCDNPYKTITIKAGETATVSFGEIKSRSYGATNFHKLAVDLNFRGDLSKAWICSVPNYQYYAVSRDMEVDVLYFIKPAGDCTPYQTYYPAIGDLPPNPLRIIHQSGGGFSPEKSVLTWEAKSEEASYERESALSGSPSDCKGSAVLDQQVLNGFFNQLRVCHDQVKTVVSDGDWNTLTLVYPKGTTFDSRIDQTVDGEEIRVVLHKELNPAVAGQQQFSCLGFQELDRYLTETIPCLSF